MNDKKQASSMTQQLAQDALSAQQSQDRALPEIAEKQIAAELRKVYGQMLAEPLPDKFAGLLDQLAKTERKS